MNNVTITAVRLLAQHSDGIILVRRASAEVLAGQWELPGGTVDPEEAAQANGEEQASLMQALAREIREEVGLQISGPGVIKMTTRYRSPSNKQIIAHVIECVAQGTVRLSDEHDDYRYWRCGDPLPMPMTDSAHAALIELVLELPPAELVH